MISSMISSIEQLAVYFLMRFLPYVYKKKLLLEKINKETLIRDVKINLYISK